MMEVRSGYNLRLIGYLPNAGIEPGRLVRFCSLPDELRLSAGPADAERNSNTTLEILSFNVRSCGVSGKSRDRWPVYIPISDYPLEKLQRIKGWRSA